MAEREIMGDACGPGSRASVEPPSGVSPVPASIPIARIIRSVAVPEFTEAEFWRGRAAEDFPPLKPLGRPCHDCAVVWGLYSPMTDSLAGQPKDIQQAVSARWYCHNHTDRACRGNIDRLAQGIEAFGRDAASRLDAKHESPVPEGDAP